jgi:hypothetical protein
MKIVEVTRDWRVVLGLALVAVGVGNWTVGRARTEQYSAIVAAQPAPSAAQSYRSFDELDAGADAVLEPFSDAQRRVYYASARMDFYHATFMTGYILAIVGLIVTFIGFRGLIRRDASGAARRLTIRARSEDPPTSSSLFHN